MAHPSGTSDRLDTHSVVHSLTTPSPQPPLQHASSSEVLEQSVHDDPLPQIPSPSIVAQTGAVADVCDNSAYQHRTDRELMYRSFLHLIIRKRRNRSGSSPMILSRCA